MDEIKLRYFISAARHLSFTKAAEDCNVTQSTISKQISALEEELGAQLFYRINSSITLTPAGERLALKAEDYMEQYRFINNSVKRLHLEQDQRLTIGVGPWEWALLSKPLKIFSERYPTVEIHCTAYTHKRIVSHLRSCTIDVGLCTSLCTNAVTGVQVIDLKTDQWKVVAGKGSSYWHLSDREKAVLKNQIVITLYENELEPVRSYCVKNNMEHMAFAYSNFYQTLIAMVEADVGVALIPSFINPESNFWGKEVAVGTELQSPLIVKFVAACNEMVHSGAARNFLEICEEVYKDVD